MAKEDRPIRTSKQDIQNLTGEKAKADSGQAGKGSDRTGLYINERGEVCYGDHCVTLAIDQKRGEVRVNIKRTATCQIEPLVKALREALDVGGMKTVYEVESEVKQDRA